MISMDKQYRTRDGREVRIYAVDGFGNWPIHGAIKTINGGWQSKEWGRNGAFKVNHENGNNADLIEVKPRIQREYWVNVNNVDCADVITGFKSKSLANSNRAGHHIACVKITIDCEEGEGL